MAILTIGDFAERTGETLDLLKQLVEIESPSTDKDAVDRLGLFLADRLRQLGAVVTVDEQADAGNNVIGQWGRGPAGILILCHMDTVYDLGTLERQPCVVIDDRIHGPGVLDMKASIAMTLIGLEMLKRHRQWPDRAVTVLFTCDEEVGSTASRPLIEQRARDAALVLCPEPCLPDGALKTWRKGVGDFEIVVRGRATHAGADHENGRNALEELAHHILAIQKLTDYTKGTTLNVGVARGGTRSNVVPDEAYAHVDMRALSPEEAERVTRHILGLQPVLSGVTLELKGGLNRPPMPRNDTMAATFQRARTIAANLGLDLKEGGTGGGSDANFVAPLGVPVLDGLGALGNGAHSEREHVYIPSLPERTALIAALVREW